MILMLVSEQCSAVADDGDAMMVYAMRYDDDMRY